MDYTLPLWTLVLSIAPLSFADEKDTMDTYASTSAKPIPWQIKGTSRSNSVLDSTASTSSPDVGPDASENFVSEEKDSPPKELYPEPRPETPFLVSAGAHSLQFLIRIKCPKALCPNSFIWQYKQNGTKKVWNEIRNNEMDYDEQNGEIISKTTVNKLKNDTHYLVRVQPTTISGKEITNWFRVSAHEPFSFPNSGLTCRDEQEGVSDLVVHSAGSKWLGLSWLPPVVACTTQLRYWVRLRPKLLPPREWRYVGSVWTNKLWSVTGNVKPCFMWPNRHCLLLTQGVDEGKEYVIDVKVVRVIDNVTSQEQITTQVAHTFAPSQPVDLRCVDTRATSLTLHWQCPLRPGGLLTQARVVVEQVETLQLVQNVTFDVRLQPEYQWKVQGLQPVSLYKVLVSFKNRGYLEGQVTSLLVWTSPKDVEASPCGGMVEKMSVNSAAAVGANTVQQSEGSGPWWAWLLVVIFLVGLSGLAFFAGRYWSNNAPWRSAKFSKSSSATSSEAGNGSSKREAELSGEDLEVLCDGAGVASKVTPPCTLSGAYSEPFYGGYARVGGPPSHGKGDGTSAPSTRSSLHAYEDPKLIYKEQPYAEALDAKALPPPYYSEVRQPSPTGMPLYAEVDKKRRLPPPPPIAPPPLPLSARPPNLQDSD